MPNQNEIPAFLGTNVPLIGNPYTLTKKVYSSIAKPVVKPVVPYAKPVVGLWVKCVKPFGKCRNNAATQRRDADTAPGNDPNHREKGHRPIPNTDPRTRCRSLPTFSIPFFNSCSSLEPGRN